MTKQLLSVGQCDFDNSQIKHALANITTCEIRCVDSEDQAVEALSEAPVDLILVNRILDKNGLKGVDVISALKSNSTFGKIPVMLVSNFAEAQDEAVKSGALQGFGKSSLDADSTAERIRNALKLK